MKSAEEAQHITARQFPHDAAELAISRMPKRASREMRRVLAKAGRRIRHERRLYFDEAIAAPLLAGTPHTCHLMPRGGFRAKFYSQFL